jgi:hypothetical protein
MRGLLALTMASLAFSATTVAALGLEDLRIGLFTALVMALAVGGLMLRPHFASRDRAAPVLAGWLLALLALASQLTPLGAAASPLDYKIALPIIALLLAPNIRAAVGDVDLARFVLRAGTLYVLLTASLALALPSAVMLRNAAADVRVDVTGSVILHASLCTIVLLAAAAALRRASTTLQRLGLVLTAVAAAWMVMLSGTRSSILAVVLFAGLWAVAGRLGEIARPRVIGLGLAVALGFIALSLLTSDTIWARLTAIGQDGYSSGRGPSIGHWLGLAAGEPFGLGIGAVRAMLAHGRPIIAGGHLLEWPHNEFVRFYVEGGIPGITIVLILVLEVARRCLRRARCTPDPLERALLLAITADMIVQCLLQNYFNSVYHATVLLLLVGMMAAAEDERERLARPAVAPSRAAGRPA